MGPAIDETLVRALLLAQFPQWALLPIAPVERQGWDNRSFRLGDHMVVRLPSAAAYAAQVEREQAWLPVLAPALSTPIPVPVARGAPACGYPWPWSIHRWVEGEAVAPASFGDSREFARDVAAFLTQLQAIDAASGPRPGPGNFHRGGALETYDAEVREAIRRLGARVAANAAAELWESAIVTRWNRPPVWVHGDMSPGNLLAIEGRLGGVLDFGAIAVGDPACDLSIAWTLFRGDARRAFRDNLRFDPATWLRARAWALWKGLILAAGLAKTNAVEWAAPLEIVERVVANGDVT